MPPPKPESSEGKRLTVGRDISLTGRDHGVRRAGGRRQSRGVARRQPE
ncbi:MAG: hypothetical protein WDO24_26710 [Pseudomonadota bacterium]